MLYTIPFLYPVGRAFEAYQNITDKALSHVRASDTIKNDMTPFLNEQGIRKDLRICELPNPGMCGAKGTNLFREGEAVLLLAPGFYEKDKQACCWVMKHEISHIKNNDVFTIPLIVTICTTAAAVFGVLTMSWLSATLLTAVVSMIVFTSFCKWREGKADDFAVEKSSTEELLGGRRFLMAMQKMYLTERQTFWRKIAISSSGDNRFDILHPSFTSRIKKIEDSLKEKNVIPQAEEEASKISDLALFMAEKKKEIDREMAFSGGF